MCVAIRDSNAAKAAIHDAYRTCEHIRQQWRYLITAYAVRRGYIGAALGAAQHAALDAAHPLLYP